MLIIINFLLSVNSIPLRFIEKFISKVSFFFEKYCEGLVLTRKKNQPTLFMSYNIFLGANHFLFR
jgi:dolichol kinase